MRKPLVAAASALLVALAAAGCGQMPGEGAPSPEEAIIQVENFHPLTVRVDALSAGDDYTLGQVETTDTEIFRVPRTVNPTDLRIRVDPIGSADVYVSDELLYDPGDVIDVEVESNLDLTTVVVR